MKDVFARKKSGVTAHNIQTWSTVQPLNVPGSMQEENPFVNLKGSTKNAEDSRVWA